MDKEIRYERDLSHSYIVMNMDDISDDDYRLKMLESINSDTVLGAGFRYINGYKYLYYAIDGCTSLKDRFSSSKMTAANIRRFFEDMHIACRDLEKYLLDESTIKLDIKTIFVSLKDDRFHFVSSPCKCEFDYAAFADDITKLVEADNANLVNIFYEFCQLMQDERLGIMQISGMMLEKIDALGIGISSSNSQTFGNHTDASNMNNEGAHMANAFIGENSTDSDFAFNNAGFDNAGKTSMNFDASVYGDVDAKSIEKESKTKDKTSVNKTTYYVYATCAFLICLIGYYVRCNYKLNQSENIASLALMAITFVLAIVFFIIGLKKKETGKKAKNNKEDEKLASTNMDNFESVSQNPVGKNTFNNLVQLNDKNDGNKIFFNQNKINSNGMSYMKTAANTHMDTYIETNQETRKDTNMSASINASANNFAGGNSFCAGYSNLYASSNNMPLYANSNLNMQGSYGTHVSAGEAMTTVLKTPSKQSACKLYSKGTDKCIQIGLDKLPLTIGKLAGCVDFVIDDSTISRIHARIDKDSDGKVFITDLGSTNGTFKNGLKLNAQSAEKLVPGDEVAFAGLVFDYR